VLEYEMVGIKARKGSSGSISPTSGDTDISKIKD
jgi:hypothetical protein